MQIIKRKNGVYYLRVQISGKRHLRSTGLREKKAAMVRAREILEQIQLQAEQPKEQHLFSRAYLREVARLESRVSKSQAERATYSYEAFLRWLGKDISLYRITLQRLEDYQAHRVLECGCSKATMDKDMAFLRALLRRNGIDIPKPEPIPAKKTPTRAFSLDELQFFLNASTVNKLPLYMTLLLTGARLAELQLSNRSTHKPLLKTEVDLDKKLIQIRKAKQRAGSQAQYRPPVPIPDALATLLTEQISRTPDDYPYVFTSDSNAARSFDATLERAGIAKENELGQVFVLHSLRHTWITLQATACSNPYMLHQIVGHSNMSMTSHYTHLTGAQPAPLDDLANTLLSGEPSPPKSTSANVIDVTPAKSVTEVVSKVVSK